jgi:hypothetical protein
MVREFRGGSKNGKETEAIKMATKSSKRKVAAKPAKKTNVAAKSAPAVT